MVRAVLRYDDGLHARCSGEQLRCHHHFRRSGVEDYSIPAQKARAPLNGTKADKHPSCPSLITLKHDEASLRAQPWLPQPGDKVHVKAARVGKNRHYLTFESE